MGRKGCFELWQHRTIPALRLKHRSGSCRTSLAVSALRIMRYCPNIPPSGNKANVRRRTMCTPMGEICVYCPLCTIKQPVGNGLDRSETEGRMSLGLLQRTTPQAASRPSQT